MGANGGYYEFQFEESEKILKLDEDQFIRFKVDSLKIGEIHQNIDQTFTIDSGTTLSYFSNEVYDLLMDSIESYCKS